MGGLPINIDEAIPPPLPEVKELGEKLAAAEAVRVV